MEDNTTKPCQIKTNRTPLTIETYDLYDPHTQQQQKMSLAHDLIAHVQAEAEEGDAKAVVDAVDAFCWSHPVMNVGDVKGAILDDILARVAPDIVVELGMFWGYSATRMASATPSHVPIISIEPSRERAAIAHQIFAHAGIQDRITWLEGTGCDMIPQLSRVIQDLVASSKTPSANDDGSGNEAGADEDGTGPKILFFFDHIKTEYVTDLQLAEREGLLPPGSVVVADNVIYPGAPEFLEYVRSSEDWDTEFFPSWLEYSTDIPDGLEVCIRK